MGLPKFLAGRIHQIRARKSYLAAHHQLWQDDLVLPVCSRCSSEDETFEYAFLSCPPRAWAKTRYLRTVTSLSQDSPFWTTPTLLVAMAKYIKATATGFPDDMPPLGNRTPMLENIDDPLTHLTPAGKAPPALPLLPSPPPSRLRGVSQFDSFVFSDLPQLLFACNGWFIFLTYVIM